MASKIRFGMKLGMALMLSVSAAPLMAKEARATAADVAAAKEILKKSVSFRTVAGQGQVPAFAAYLASVLKAAGYADSDVEITPLGETAMLTATLRGTTRAKPIVLLGHMDVVAANPADWARDPFTAVEEGDYIFGRGAEDNKYDVTMMVATMARLKREGFRPKRDIILALSGDEETGMLTTRALAQKFKGAELALNGDGGGGILGPDHKPVLYSLQAGEKTYTDYQIEITDPGGHSSAPTSTNAIYRMAKVLDRLGAYRFPVQSNELTVASLKAASKQLGGELGEAMARYAADPTDAAAAETISAKPEYVGQIRTTCTATMVDAGHAPNALPQRATANVNCRIFPGVSIDTIKAKLAEIIADPSAKITVLGDPAFSDASPLRPDVMNAMTKAIRARYPKLEIAPGMSAGATDSLHFRALGVPSYGVSSLFMRPEDGFAHGLNERVPVATIGAALDQWHSVLTDIGK